MDQEFDQFAKEIVKHFLDNEQIAKQIFIDLIPNYLNIETCDKRRSFLAGLENQVSKQNVIGFLKIQTMGRDYQHFDLIMKLRDTEFQYDDNGMFVFNDNFDAANFKPEALIIWWILHLITLHPFISQFSELLGYILQESNLEKYMKIDLCFKILSIVIEIDELHHIKNREQKIKDSQKNATCQNHGYAYLRFPFYDIVKYAKTQEISLSQAFLNSKILTDFKNSFFSLVENSLMQFVKPRQTFIMNLFIAKSLARINHLNQRIQIVGSGDSNNQNLLSSLHHELDICNTIIDNYSDSNKVASNIFTYKDRSRSNQYSKIINFNELCNLFQCDSSSNDKEQLKQYLLGLGFIDSNLIQPNKYLLSWKELLLAVFKWGQNNDLKEILFYYCSEIEESYKIVIHKIEQFMAKSKSSVETAKLYSDYIRKRYLKESTSKVNSYKLMVSQLNEKIADREKQIKELLMMHERADAIKIKMEPIIFQHEEDLKQQIQTAIAKSEETLQKFRQMHLNQCQNVISNQSIDLDFANDQESDDLSDSDCSDF